MQILKARPLATACIASMAASVVSCFISSNGRLLMFILLALLSLFAFIAFWHVRKDSQRPARYTVCLTIFLSFLLSCLTVLTSAFYFGKTDEIAAKYADQDEVCLVQCVILEEKSAGTGYSCYTVSVESIQNMDIHFRAELECTYTATFHMGDVVQMEVLAQSLASYYDRDMLTFAIADHIRLGLISQDDSSAQVIETRVMPIRRFFSNCRENLSERLYHLVGKRDGGFATALFLGDRSGVDERITMTYRRTGIAHLLALSGMHVTLLMGLASSLAIGVYLPKRARLLILSVLSVFYLALIGFTISATRAVGMLLLFYLADMIGKRHDSLTTLCCIGAGMLTLSPATVADGGFWMSFAAVFGLVTVYAEFNEWLSSKHIHSKIRTVLSALTASAIAVISVSFLNWLFNGEISWIGIVLTAVLSPVLAVVLTLILLSLLLDLIPFLSATPLVLPLKTLLDFMIDLAEWVARFPKVSVSLVPEFTGPMLACMTIVILLLMILPLRRKLWLAVPPLITVLAFVIGFGVWEQATYRDQLQLSYVARNSGSALVVADQEGVAIIDTSAGSFSMMRDAEQAASVHGATEIEHLILTHYHRAYIYSTERLAKRQILRHVWLPMPQTEEEYHYLTAMCERLVPLGVELRCYRHQDEITLFDSAVFQLTDSSYLDRSKQPIITYLLQTPSETLTLTSPAVAESTYYPTFRWLSEYTDVLILSNHGPVIKQTMYMPFGHNRPTIILSDSSELLACLDLSPDSSLYEIPHITDITCYRFPMIK